MRLRKRPGAFFCGVNCCVCNDPVECAEHIETAINAIGIVEVMPFCPVCWWWARYEWGDA